MTNGEKIQTILDVDKDCTEVHGENGTMTFTVTQNWWNAEYKEPSNSEIPNKSEISTGSIIKQEIPVKLHVTEIKKHQSDFSDLEPNHFVNSDKMVEPITKNDDHTINGLDDFIEFGKKAFGVELIIKKSDNPDTYEKLFGTTKNDLAVSNGLENGSPIIDWNNCHTSEQLDSIATTKDDLGVDCISRADAIDDIKQLYLDLATQKAVIDLLKILPSVTPQEPRKGHWIPVYQGDEIIDYRCSECEFGNTFGRGTFGMNFCPRCGSNNREEEE